MSYAMAIVYDYLPTINSGASAGYQVGGNGDYSSPTAYVGDYYGTGDIALDQWTSDTDNGFSIQNSYITFSSDSTGSVSTNADSGASLSSDGTTYNTIGSIV